MKQRYPGEPRNALAAVFGSMGEAKHVFVYDDDIDVFSDEQCDWAFATRFQADRDMITGSGFRTVPLDPSLGGQPHRREGRLRLHHSVRQARMRSSSRCRSRRCCRSARARASFEVLSAGPASFLELMAAAGSRDGRDVVRELDKLYASDSLGRQSDGRYVLKTGHVQEDE